MNEQPILCKMTLLCALYDVFCLSYISFSEGQRPFFPYFSEEIAAKKRLLAFTKTDVAQAKNVVENWETSDFVDHWLLYHYWLLKPKKLS
jgi:hypothetical protein